MVIFVALSVKQFSEGENCKQKLVLQIIEIRLAAKLSCSAKTF